MNFNPRSPWGERRAPFWLHCHHDNFNPRSPWGERRMGPYLILRSIRFQSTLPVGGATEEIRATFYRMVISIHAPRGGSDLYKSPVQGRQYISIHAPRGGSDGQRYRHSHRQIDFNPRSPWGERPKPYQPHLPTRQFQSTLPVGGATGQGTWSSCFYVISIHAPRGGSD